MEKFCLFTPTADTRVADNDRVPFAAPMSTNRELIHNSSPPHLLAKGMEVV